MNHRIGRVLFASAVGLLVAYLSYQWIVNPAGREARALQLGVVESSRRYVLDVIQFEGLEIVDPLAPNRKAGKVYIYPEGRNWSVSGYYRRGENDHWHPYLISLDADLQLLLLKIKDKDGDLLRQAKTDPLLEVSP